MKPDSKETMRTSRAQARKPAVAAKTAAAAATAAKEGGPSGPAKAPEPAAVPAEPSVVISVPTLAAAPRPQRRAQKNRAQARRSFGARSPFAQGLIGAASRPAPMPAFRTLATLVSSLFTPTPIRITPAARSAKRRTAKPIHGGASLLAPARSVPQLAVLLPPPIPQQSQPAAVVRAEIPVSRPQSSPESVPLPTKAPAAPKPTRAKSIPGASSAPASAPAPAPESKAPKLTPAKPALVPAPTPARKAKSVPDAKVSKTVATQATPATPSPTPTSTPTRIPAQPPVPVTAPAQTTGKAPAAPHSITPRFNNAGDALTAATAQPSEPVAEVVWGNLRIPAILLEGDYDTVLLPTRSALLDHPVDPEVVDLMAVQAEPIPAAIDTVTEAFLATLPWAEPDGGGLPASYNTRELYLTARDPHCLHAHWDFSQEQLELYASFAATGRLELRLHIDSHGSQSNRTFFATAATRSWFFHDVPANSRFTLELGYTDASGNWSQLAASAVITTPPDAIAAPFLAPAPAPVPTPAPIPTPTPATVPAMAQVLAPEVAPAPNQTPEPFLPTAHVLLPVVEQAPAAFTPLAPAEHATGFTPTPPKAFEAPRHNEVPHRLVVDWAQQSPTPEPDQTDRPPLAPSAQPSRSVWQIAPEIAAALRREISPVSSAELVVTSSNPDLVLQAEELCAKQTPEIPAGAPPNPVSSQEFEAPPKAKRRGFWFNVNAELIVYGATEPDAALMVDGKPVPLRPDGSFSFRFALPDGVFELPIEALSADREDGRGVTLHFQRKSDYLGPVGQHPQDAALEPPPHAPSPPWPVAV